MKIGKIRTDWDNRYYVVPEEEIDEFDVDLRAINNWWGDIPHLPGLTSHKDMFENNYQRFQVRELEDLEVIMREGQYD